MGPLVQLCLDLGVELYSHGLKLRVLRLSVNGAPQIRALVFGVPKPEISESEHQASCLPAAPFSSHKPPICTPVTIPRNHTQIIMESMAGRPLFAGALLAPENASALAL